MPDLPVRARIPTTDFEANIPQEQRLAFGQGRRNLVLASLPETLA